MNINSKAMWANAEMYEKNQLTPLIKLEREKEIEIKALEEIAKNNRFKGSKLVEAIAAYYFAKESATLKIEIANIRVKLAEKRYEISKYILSNIGAFADTEKVEVVADIDNQFSDIRNSKINLNADLVKLCGEMNDLLKNWLSHRQIRLNYTDFLYFSLGISTTTTFGDLIPNNKNIRLLVTLQLMLSVVIVGGFVSRATMS